MKIEKILLISGLSIVSLNSMAASTSSEFKVGATVNAGCIVSAENINFGELQVSQSNRYIKKIADAPLTIQCSKCINIQLTGSSINNQSFYLGPKLWLDGSTTDLRQTRIRYGVQMNNVQTNDDITITKAARYNYLWNVSCDHHFNFKIKTSNKVVLPIYGQLLDHIGISDTNNAPLDLFTIKSGNYTDTYTYTLTF